VEDLQLWRARQQRDPEARGGRGAVAVGRWPGGSGAGLRGTRQKGKMVQVLYRKLGKENEVRFVTAPRSDSHESRSDYHESL
jgi:hypothetical protein